MKYTYMERAVFLERPNRFIAYVEQNGRRELCHVKNTGRCRELLIPGAQLYVQRNENPTRKTPLDLIAVRKKDVLINMDSQAPNQAVGEWLKKGIICGKDAQIRPEYRYKDSRFDFFVRDQERRIMIEVKGVTLEEDGIAWFPDAPTERGLKHIQELCTCMQEGFEAFLIFVIQMKGVRQMRPNDRTHPAFGQALRTAAQMGVRILAYDCLVAPDSIELDQRIEVIL